MQHSIPYKLSKITRGCLLATSLVAGQAIAQEATQPNGDDLEVITVTGIKGSVKQSLNDKRFSSEILDTISAEDIGQLPDENIAEALQRVTGIQMSRTADGQGSSVQIRGLSDNNVEINGQALAGSSADRSINFQDLPSELFSGIEIQKAPTADKIEGSLGGTINLKTRRPLNNNTDFLGSITARAKYSENAEELDPDVNFFVLKNWRDTSLGDIGLILNAAHRQITTNTETYGGGDFEDAPAVWLRRSGDRPTGFPNPAVDRGGNNANGANFFSSLRGASLYTYDQNVDVNGDGLSDSADQYYIPGGFGFSEGIREDKRDSFNATLHWQPNDDVNLYFDTTMTSGDERQSGSRYAINGNSVRSGALISDANQYEQIGTSDDLGDIYVMTAGRVGAMTTRMGASPNLNHLERDSEMFTLSGDWSATDSLLLSAEVSVSEGNANTVEQGALIMGIDANNNGRLTGSDFAQYVDFNLNGNGIPSASLFAPFTTQGADVIAEATNPLQINPADSSYERLNYFQLNRVAADTKNTADAFRIDGEWELEHDVFTQVTFGLRLAERTFERRTYQNPNQRNGESSLFEGGELRSSVNVQAIRVNPEQNADSDTQAAAEFLQTCLLDGGRGDFFGDEPSNLPRVWTTTLNCSPTQLNDAFGLQDIRADLPDSPGVGIYEQRQNRFDVDEQTQAAYVATAFETEFADLPFFGNMGVRYVKTEVSSLGIETSATAQLLTFEHEYSDLLPSLNANLALTDDMILRLGLSRTLGRPGLVQLSPSAQLTLNDDVEGLDGFGRGGNPFLEPVRSNNIDLSYEWYYHEASLFSIAYFNKNIDTRIVSGEEEAPREIDGLLYEFESAINGPGTKIDGVEVAVQHSFSEMDGLFSHTGLGVNYTFTNEDTDFRDQEGDPISRRGLSEHSYNITAFYDDGTFSARLAYNWRDEFTRREEVDLGFARPERLPEIEAARGQLDFTANYQVTSALKINFSAINLNNSETRRYMKYEQLLNYLAQPGRRYNLGLVYRF